MPTYLQVMCRGVEATTALVAAAKCSVPDLLRFAVRGRLAVLQDLREKPWGCSGAFCQ